MLRGMDIEFTKPIIYLIKTTKIKTPVK